MSMIFFKQPAALDRDKHRNTRLKPAANGHSFAKGVNAVPLTITEMGVACSEYPIVFALNEDGTGSPMALLGVRDNENLFVDAEGTWTAHYIPGFVRCYPFALQASPDGEKVIIAIDDGYEGLNDEEGIQLFSENGEPTESLQQTLSALEQFYHQERASKDFVAMLNRNGLLVPRTLEVNGPNNQKILLNGVHVVDEEKIATLSDAVLLELARTGGFGFIYAHILSLGLLSRLMQRLEPLLVTEAA